MWWINENKSQSRERIFSQSRSTLSCTWTGKQLKREDSLQLTESDKPIKSSQLDYECPLMVLFWGRERWHMLSGSMDKEEDMTSVLVDFPKVWLQDSSLSSSKSWLDRTQWQRSTILCGALWPRSIYKYIKSKATPPHKKTHMGCLLKTTGMKLNSCP